MIDISSDLPFVICSHCIRGFDVDHWNNRTRNTTKYGEVVNDKGDIVDIKIEAECPHCFEYGYYDMERDYHWATDVGDVEVGLAGKKIMITEVENDALRKSRIQLKDKITLLERDLAQLKKDRTKLRKENKKLADSIHLARPNEKVESPKERGKTLPYS
jgi:hypothetical protein